MGKNKGAKAAAKQETLKETPKEAPREIEGAPGFFGHTIKPGQTLVWANEDEELALQLTSAALGAKVVTGRSTLFADVKDSKIALCTLVPEKVEQWNLAHLFTPYDGPVVFHNEGVNEIHLTGMIDVQDDEGDHDGHDHPHDHDHSDEDDYSEDDQLMVDGTYSDSDDGSDVMIFGGDDDDDDEDDDDDDDETDDEIKDEGRFEVVEERLHGDLGEKKKKEAEKTTEDAKIKAEPTKDKKDAKKDESAPSKKDSKKEETSPSKKEAKKEAKQEKQSPAADKDAKSKKRPAETEQADASKKAKTTTRVYKGVTIEETAVGTGQPIKKGTKVKILYKGRLQNGKQFDAQQNRKTPFVFRHGIGDVIKGMDIGIEGMRSGGKRTLTIPAHLGYGKSGSPPAIPSNATLIFEIELL